MKSIEWKTYKKDIEKRIDKLTENEFYVEVVFIFANMIEAELKEILNIHNDISQAILKKSNIPAKKINKHEKLTLGKLIKECEFLINPEIKTELMWFKELRDGAIHKLLQSDIKHFESKVKESIPKFYKIMTFLADISIKLLKNQIKNQPYANKG